jgi:hypothetical protein
VPVIRMSLYEDNWSSRREPVTVPYLNDDGDEDDEDTERMDARAEPVHWGELAAAAIWFLIIVVVLGVMGLR